jgi:hypothetical protein
VENVTHSMVERRGSFLRDVRSGPCEIRKDWSMAACGYLARGLCRSMSALVGVTLPLSLIQRPGGLENRTLLLGHGVEDVFVQDKYERSGSRLSPASTWSAQVYGKARGFSGM